MNDYRERKNPHRRLYRDREHAMLAGVCAGIAEYFGLNRKGLRLVTVLLMLIPPFFAFVLISYLILAIVLPAKPADLYETEEQASFWRDVNNAPSDLFGSLSHRFRELNLRLERMEAYVTSKEFQMDRELGRK
jgi:phage shock protein C